MAAVWTMFCVGVYLAGVAPPDAAVTHFQAVSALALATFIFGGFRVIYYFQHKRKSAEEVDLPKL